MKLVAMVASLLCFISSFCQAQENDLYQESSQQYYPGYTLVSLYNFNVKFVAEQRTSDKMVQIVVVPQEMDVQFQIQNVTFQVAPADANPSGPEAVITGVFAVQLGYQSPTPMQKTIKVQISDVFEFSISQDEAMMQGNPVYRKELPSMLSSQ